MRPLRTLALVAAAALVGAGAGRAQSEEIDVRADPGLPIAGQPLAAVVTFGDLSPDEVTAVTFAVRRVGEVGYQDVAAGQQPDGAWRAELPFDAPPEGLEAFLRYTTLGQTFTEPIEAPEADPVRIPVFIPALTSDVSLPARQYRMVTVPVALGGTPDVPFPLAPSAPLDVFGDDYGATGDPALWRLLRWNEAAGRAFDAVAEPGLLPRVRPGEGYWLIASGGGPFDVTSAVAAGTATRTTPTGAIGTMRVPVVVEIPPGWSQIGNPFLFPLAWSDVEQLGAVEPPIAFDGAYVGGQTVLRPWEGYFVFNPGEPAALRFPAAPRAAAGAAAAAASLEAQIREATGARVARVTAVADGRADAVVVGMGTGPSLRKPPPIDDAVRLAVREGDTDRLAHVHAAPEWALALRTEAPVELRVEPLGDWPGAFVVDDLDRGVTLALEDGRMTVPALGLGERRLRLRLADAPPESALGRPFPNPSSGAVTVPLRLAARAHVRAEVLDVLGRVVRVLADGELGAGAHPLSWDGHDGAGQPAAAGAYLLRVNAGGVRATARLTRPR